MIRNGIARLLGIGFEIAILVIELQSRIYGCESEKRIELTLSGIKVPSIFESIVIVFKICSSLILFIECSEIVTEGFLL